jgi:outer membrane murein-binding lipoprotein Lpp
MDDELISALRRVLEEDVVRELRALGAGLDRISSQLEMNQRLLEAKVDALLQDIKSMREEMQAMREEMKTLREDAGPSKRHSQLIH